MIPIKAIQKVYTKKGYFLLSILSFFGILFLYYFAIESSASWFIFTNANKPIYVILQIVLSIINALLIAISLSMFIYVLKDKKIKGESNLFGTFGSLVLSIGTTGCYVCGSILLPSLSLGASFLTLPFGGLEVKVLTILLSIYTIREYSLNILGLCKIKRIKNYKLRIQDLTLRFSNKRYINSKPVIIFVGFTLIILLLPSISSMLGLKRSFAESSYVCSEDQGS